MIIYKATNKINGKIYIGQTIRTLEYRWAQHCRDKRKTALHSTIKKYGKDAFKLEILSKCKSIKEMNYKEEYYIKLLNTLAPNGYNLSTGGDNKRHHESSKRKIGAANRGRKHSKKSIKLMSKNRKGKGSGWHQTEEAKRKIGEAHIGLKPWLGKKHSKKTRLRMSKVQKERRKKEREQHATKLL